MDIFSRKIAFLHSKSSRIVPLPLPVPQPQHNTLLDFYAIVWFRLIDKVSTNILSAFQIKTVNNAGAAVFDADTNVDVYALGRKPYRNNSRLSFVRWEKMKEERQVWEPEIFSGEKRTFNNDEFSLLFGSNDVESADMEWNSSFIMFIITTNNNTFNRLTGIMRFRLVRIFDFSMNFFFSSQSDSEESVETNSNDCIF